MKQLVIAEKPSVARDIARVLRCTKQINGGIEGETYIVTWALGHLVTLADPEQYSNRYKTWNMEDLPMIPAQFKLEVIKKTSKQFKSNDYGFLLLQTKQSKMDLLSLKKELNTIHFMMQQCLEQRLIG